MKCPVCDFITNPEKDLCTRCFSDLREAKAELGIKVYQPELSYEQLLASKVKIVSKKNKPEEAVVEGRSLFGTLKKIFNKKSLVENDLQIPVQESVTTEQNMQADQESQNTAAPQLNLRLAKRQKEQVLGLLRRRKKARQDVEEKALIAQGIQFGPEVRIDSEIDSLYNKAAFEISAATDFHASKVIAGSELIKVDALTDLKALFELAAVELLNPNQSKKFIDPLDSRKVTQLDSEQLQAAVRVYEHEDIDYQIRQASSAIKINKRIEGQTASVWLRLKAWLLDTSISLFLALLFALIAEVTFNPFISSLLLAEFDFSLAETYSLFSKALVFYVLIKHVLLVFIRAVYGRTLAENYFQLNLVNENDTKANIALSFLWSLADSFVIFSFGLFEWTKLKFLSKERICSAKMLWVP